MNQIWTIMLFISSLFGCGSKEKIENFPDDLSVSLFESGGMLPYSYHLYLQKDTCREEIWDEGNKTIHTFFLTEEQRKELWKVLVENRFDKIKMREEEVYDRGGTSVQITYNNHKKVFNISDSGMTYIKDGWRENWQNIISEIYKLANTELNKQKILVKFEVKDILTMPHAVRIYGKNNMLFNKNREDKNFETKTLEMYFYEGKHEVSISVEHNNGSFYNNKIIQVEKTPLTFSIDIQSDTIQITP